MIKAPKRGLALAITMHVRCQPDMPFAALYRNFSCCIQSDFTAYETCCQTAHLQAPFCKAFTTIPLCKIIPACLNFRVLVPANLSYQPQPAKSAIFGKIVGKTINLA